MRDRRDRQERRTHIRTGLCLLVGAGGFLALSGVSSCADALHLDPPLADGGSDAHQGPTCASSQDCTYPTGTCDLGSHTCVGCLSNGDCSYQPGTICSQGACACPPVDGASPRSYCAGESPGCVDLTTSQANCGGCGIACFGQCAASKCVDPWTPTGLAGAPEPRSHHVAVWTGSKMFVWGGKNGSGLLASGGLYDPVKQVWVPTSTFNAPSPRADATAVWDGKEVIVWGGTGPGGVVLGTGSRYDPAQDIWSSTSKVSSPAARTGHTAVWAATLTPPVMIVWGGSSVSPPAAPGLGDGAAYDPAKDTWLGVTAPSGNEPGSRYGHTAVWAPGPGMIVFGGYGTAGTPGNPATLADGYAWDGASMWTALPTAMAPAARLQHTAVWDPMDAEMVIFGGLVNGAALADGYAYTPSGPAWATLNPPQPEPRWSHSAVYLANGGIKPLMLVFGGEDASGLLGNGWSLDIKAGIWAPISSAPAARSHHTAVVAGPPTAPVMIVWGGDTQSGPTSTGALFDPTGL